MGLADLHIHTSYSYDGTASVPEVLRKAKQLGLNVIAITDHDEVAGALEATQLASHYGIEVIPGVEITTAEGDLLAYFITEKVDAGLSYLETILRVRELGGVCIAAHPMSKGVGMNSVTPDTLIQVLKHPQAAETLIGVEVYNGTSIDRLSNHYARILAMRLKIANTGNSDAHILETIGFGATEFEGSSTRDLLAALKKRTTKVRKIHEWSPLHIISSWGMRYISSTLAKWAWVGG